MPDSPSLPTLFAARLVQARELRKLSQRALGDSVGLGKATGSTRINRYERGTSSVSLASLEALAATLDVPAAFLLANSAEMAEAILAFDDIPRAQHAGVAKALTMIANDHDFLALLLHAATCNQEDWDAVVAQWKAALRGAAKGDTNGPA